MAKIEFKIDVDKKGYVTVRNIVHRIDPKDEIILDTGTAGTTLRWVGQSPFKDPADVPLYPLPRVNGSDPILHVRKATGMSGKLADCGKVDAAGKFHPWVEGSGGFPGTSGTEGGI